MSRSNGMEIPRKMQVDFVHRQYLGITASSRTTFQTETRAERGFSQSHDVLFPNVAQSQSQTYRNGSLAYTGLRGSNGRNQNQITVFYFFLVNQ